jgi:hypothetical protein
MTTIITPAWEQKRTDETRMVESVLKAGGFDRVDAYRYNSASIRIRVIDPRFESMRWQDRDALVEPYLDQLPEGTQADIISLYTFSPSELVSTPKTFREFMENAEFEDPSPSVL